MIGGKILKEVSAGGVVYYEENNQLSILLIEDRSHKLTLPKGKSEEGETIEETALREIKEETGIEGEIIKPLDKVYYEYYHPIYNKVEKEVHFYLVKALTNEISVQLSEINSAAWYSLEDTWRKQQDLGYENNLNILKMALVELGFKIN